MANLKLVTIVTIVILSFILFIFPAPDGTIYTVFRIFVFIIRKSKITQNSTHY